jgi:hypothetical protein
MLENRKSAAPLLLAGLAAFAYYKYSKMTPEKKHDLKEKGKDLLDKYVPQSVKKLFSKGKNTQEQFV